MNCREFPGGPVVRIPLACSLAEGEGSITSWEIKISEVLQCSQKRKKKKQLKYLLHISAMREDPGLIPELGRLSWRRKWQSTPVFLPGKAHGQREAWQVTGVIMSQTQLHDFTFNFFITY